MKLLLAAENQLHSSISECEDVNMHTGTYTQTCTYACIS